MVPKQILFSLLILFLLGVATATAPAPASTRFGDYEPIKDPNDPYVVEIAKFAVSEHNKRKSEDLVFVKVVSGQQQAVYGMDYNLIIAVNHGGAVTNSDEAKYQVVVYDRPGAGQKKHILTSFEKA